MARKKSATKKKTTRSYSHDSTETPLRPDVGTQAQFKKKKPPVRYSYDSSLSPALDWDGTNPARAEAEALIAAVLEAETLESAKAAAEQLKALSEPFLNWSGKAEHLSFDVPTLPLFVHERLSTRAIIDTLRGHKRESKEQLTMDDLFGGTSHDITDQVLRAYEYQDRWVNRLVLGDSLVVMNSLLHYEGMAEKVQMVFMDPPYGVKFGSNFQPFVRKRGVKHNDDASLTREPEMVQAYRDTWELGLHTYLTYLRDRLLLCRELLSPTGSVFVQISDDNLHHVRELLDEVFGASNFLSLIPFTKAPGGLEASSRLSTRTDYLVWYAKDSTRNAYQPLYEKRDDPIADGFDIVELPDGTRRKVTRKERAGDPLPSDARLAMSVSLTKPGPGSRYEIDYAGRTYTAKKRWWGMPKESLQSLIDKNRVVATEGDLRFLRYLDDFPYRNLNNLWDGLAGAPSPLYVVQTNEEVVRRCMLMTTQPGDLVLDPTCGSGTTAKVAEQWGRRWISSDVSRVPLALTRQRLLTSTFPWYELQDESRGPLGGFQYSAKGAIPRLTPSSVANDDAPKHTLIVDRPDVRKDIVRVSGPFSFEATLPTPHDWKDSNQEGTDQAKQAPDANDEARLLEALRKSPVLRMEGGHSIQLSNVRPPAKTLSLSAEATLTDGDGKLVAFVFGPENGAVSERLIYQAALEAHAKNYTQLYVLGFAIQPTARKLVDSSHAVIGIPATYVQATPDLLMGDLLKNMRSSQVFSVCGLPEVKVHRDGEKFQVELIGLDVFDPATMEVDGRRGNDVPAWLLDSNHNGLCFRATQVFFPRTGAWNNLKKALKGTHDESVWDHLAGTTSAPFERGEHGQIAVKVIDDRGNELMVVEELGA